MAERHQEQTEMSEHEFRIVFLIGNGSRLSSILDNILDDPEIEVTLVVSHRKPPGGAEDVVGIAGAKGRGIPTAYWNLVQMNLADKKANPNHNDDEYRALYMNMLGDFLTQQYYKPDLVVMTGWDLILDDNIINKIRFAGARIINVHPHPLPGTKDEYMDGPDGSKVRVFKGLETWVKAIESKSQWSGATVHEVLTSEFDTGTVLALEWVKIEPGEDANSLRGKLNTAEDKIVPQTIKKVKEEMRAA